MSASKDRKIVEMHAEIAELRDDLAAARAALEEVCDALLTTDKNEQAMRMYQIAYAAIAGEKK